MTTKSLLLAGAMGVLGLATAPAQVLISGNSMGVSDPTLISSINQLGFSYAIVPPSQFTATSLIGISMVWLDGFSQYGSGLTTKLDGFLAGGGTLLVQSPGFGSEPLSSYPLGATLGATFTFPPGENVIRLTGTSPLNAGLTGSALSGWNASAAGIFTSVGSFTVLSDNGSSSAAITLTQTVGPGHLVYTQMGISQRLSAVNDPAARLFLSNVFAIAVPEPGTLGLLAAGLIAFAAVRRRQGKRS